MRYLVTGGTGTLGSEIIRKLLQEKGAEVVCFSRDDHKQKALAKRLGYPPGLAAMVGDIRDLGSLARACRGVDVLFHVAALKHVDVGQREMREYAKTDLIGTFNVADAAQDAGIPFVVFSSTDKAVDPVNGYGALKLASEVFLYGENARGSKTRFSVFRWGNVLGSQGSIIPDFVEQIVSTGSYMLTHPDMTRFWIPIERAVDFMLENYRHAPTDRALVPPIRAAKVTRVAEAIAQILGVKPPKPNIIGLRAGEKMHEVLSSMHTPLPVISSSDPARQMTDEELRSLLVPIIAPLVTEKKIVVRKRFETHREALAQA